MNQIIIKKNRSFLVREFYTKVTISNNFIINWSKLEIRIDKITCKLFHHKLCIFLRREVSRNITSVLTFLSCNPFTNGNILFLVIWVRSFERPHRTNHRLWWHDVLHHGTLCTAGRSSVTTLIVDCFTAVLRQKIEVSIESIHLATVINSK